MSPMNNRLMRPRAGGGATDADALAYIAAVEIADGQKLEPAVVKAIEDFVIGCKADSIWTKLKASCILMGARTLAGALTPLVGSSPTNNGPFVAADYNRSTGLVGNGSTKYLSTNRAGNADDSNDTHMSVMVHTAGTGTAAYMGQNGFSDHASSFTHVSADMFFALRSGEGTAAQYFTATGGNAAGFIGATRSGSTGFTWRHGATTGFASIPTAAASVTSANFEVFGRGVASRLPTNGRLRWYSLGSNLDLALLRTRLDTLVAAVAAAIP